MKWLIGLLVAMALAQPATAQSVVNCVGTNTTVASPIPTVVINTCNVTAGPNGIILATATAEVTCAVNEKAEMFVGTGSSPVGGSTIAVPSGVQYITRQFDQTGCAVGKTTLITIAGALDATMFGAGVGTAYWIGVDIFSSAGGPVTWNNNRVDVFTY